MIEQVQIELSKLENNSGQVAGLPANPRLIKDGKFDKLIKSIKEDPEMLNLRELIVYPLEDKYIVIAGNMRLQAMRELQYTHASCKVLDSATDVDKLKAYTIKDNNSFGEYDFELLANEWDVETLLDWGVDLPVDFCLIDDEEQEFLTDEDDVPELPTEPVTKLGDVWLLGNHRLMCGDSTSIDAVEKLLNDAEPNLMVTDPPYGVKYEADWRAKAENRDKTEREQNSNLLNDDKADWYDAWVLFRGDIAYVWHASMFTDVVMNSLRKADFEVKQSIIWNKNVHSLSRSNYHWKHEPCWYAVRNGKDSNWQAGRDQMTVWDISNVMFEKQKTSHPTQKPLPTFEKPILNHTKENDAVYEPFGGSGTQIIACEKLNRISYTMELDPKYCDVIIKRWQDFTGKSAILESTRETFNSLEKGV